jgi:hypothetical protein
MLKPMAENHEKIVTFAPHPTPIFQVLDASLFGVLKKKKQFQFPFDNIDGTHLFIRKVYDVSKQTMTTDTIRDAFMPGYQSNIRPDPYTLNFEMWETEYLLKGLSPRR